MYTFFLKKKSQRILRKIVSYCTSIKFIKGIAWKEIDPQYRYIIFIFPPFDTFCGKINKSILRRTKSVNQPRKEIVYRIRSILYDCTYFFNFCCSRLDAIDALVSSSVQFVHCLNPRHDTSHFFRGIFTRLSYQTMINIYSLVYELLSPSLKFGLW